MKLLNFLRKFIEYIYSKFIAVQVFIIRFVFGLLFNFRFIGLLTLVFIAIASLFNIGNAKLTNEILVLCAFIFLASTLSELKNWNLFNGFIKGETKDLSHIPENGGINSSQTKPTSQEVEEAENKPLQLMADDKGNFLALAFEIERLLRVLATVTLNKDVPSTTSAKKVVDDLHSVGMVTDLGKQQIEAIRWLRNLLVHGRDSEINQETLLNGIRLAYSLYNEIYNWLNKPQSAENE
jgi:hypothetical protein